VAVARLCKSFGDGELYAEYMRNDTSQCIANWCTVKPTCNGNNNKPCLKATPISSINPNPLHQPLHRHRSHLLQTRNPTTPPKIYTLQRPTHPLSPPSQHHHEVTHPPLREMPPYISRAAEPHTFKRGQVRNTRKRVDRAEHGE